MYATCVTSVSSFLLYNALHSSSGFELPAGQISLASQGTGASSDHYNTPNKIHAYHHCLKYSLNEFPWFFMATYTITLTWLVTIFAYFKFTILLGMPVEMHAWGYGLSCNLWVGGPDGKIFGLRSGCPDWEPKIFLSSPISLSQ